MRLSPQPETARDARGGGSDAHLQLLHGHRHGAGRAQAGNGAGKKLDPLGPFRTAPSRYNALAPGRVDYLPMIDRPVIRWPDECAGGVLGRAQHRALRVSAPARRRAQSLAAHAAARRAAVFAARVRQPRGVLAPAGSAGPVPDPLLDHPQHRRAGAFPGHRRGHARARLDVREPRLLQHPLHHDLLRGAGARVLPALPRDVQAPHRPRAEGPVGACRLESRSSIPPSAPAPSSRAPSADARCRRFERSLHSPHVNKTSRDRVRDPHAPAPDGRRRSENAEQDCGRADELNLRPAWTSKYQGY